MRIIEKCWVDLSDGYQTIQLLETRLKSDWRRAVRVARKREDQAAKSRSDRKRKIAGILLLALFLALIVFCAGVYYLPEIQLQLFVYFCMLGIPGIILCLVFILTFTSTSGTRRGALPSMEIEEEWWTLLRPKRYPRREGGDQGELNFLQSLSFLDDSYIAVWGLLTSAKIRSDTDVLLLGPNGIWIFEVKYWNGTIIKQDGVWYAIHRSGKKQPYPKSPDEQWLQQKEEVSKTIKMRLMDKAWPAELLKGGIVFTHQNSEFGQIDHPQAAYGKPGAWHKRITETQPLEGFSMRDKLQVLDVLMHYANRHEREKLNNTSASDAASTLYDNAVSVLRKYVAERVK